jgi:formamidopyrimidine-DNA glycosylase
MPELPEVETIVRGLRGYVVGRTIVAVDITLARIAEPSADIVRSALPGRKIVDCMRRAKYIVFKLDTGELIRVHLRMTGRLVYSPPSKPKCDEAPPKYTHLTLSLDNNSRLYFADARTFGRVSLVPKGEVWDSALGIEPLDDVFTPLALSTLLAKKRGAIKSVLLDQRFIAGIGNIYACEALWQSRIDPHTPSGDLSKKQITALHEAIVDVLSRSVEMRGTSARDYVDAEGLKGGFQNVLTVYGRHGEPCQRCSGEIERVVLGQRGTWWCPRCQTGQIRKQG